MKATLIVCVFLFMLVGGALYAANGDLIINGNMGVGNTAPIAKLDAAGIIRSTSIGTGWLTSGAGLEMWYGFPDINTGYILAWDRTGNVNKDLSLGATGSGMIIKSNGNVGVGTTTPEAKLDTSGIIRSTSIGSGLLTNGAGLEMWYGYPDANTGYILAWDRTGDVNRDLSFGRLGYGMIIKSSGNIGIGTLNPEVKLDVAGGDIQLTSGHALYSFSNGNFSAANARWGSCYANSSDGGTTILTAGKGSYANNLLDINFARCDGTSVTKMMTIQASTGNVGIGTTNPQYLLDVAGEARISGAVYPSDIRFKRDIEPISDSLNKVLKLSGVSFKWRTDEYKDRGFTEGKHYGVIAQEVEKNIPDVVNTTLDGTKAVAYTEIIPILIEAMKEQQKLIEKQQTEIGQLKELLVFLQNRR
jgi:hypothetical protein